MKKVIATDRAPAAVGPYSQAVTHNGIAYVSGQIPIDPASGELLRGDIEGQTRQVLNNLKGVLEAAGSGMEQVLKITVYLKDMSDFAGMNKVFAEFFEQDPPARAAIEAARLPKDVGVEMDAIAIAEGR
jgi:2-iminobutanoate/2-iminopropanoate deaminase